MFLKIILLRMKLKILLKKVYSKIFIFINPAGKKLPNLENISYININRNIIKQ